MQARAYLEDVRPDVTVVCGTTYLRSATIAAGGLMINIHGGFLPHYKGNHCVFFAFLRKDYQRIGASLHLVAGKLDGGELLEVVRPEIRPQDNDQHLYDRSVQLAIDRLVEILTVFETGIRSCGPSRRRTRGRPSGTAAASRTSTCGCG